MVNQNYGTLVFALALCYTRLGAKVSDPHAQAMMIFVKHDASRREMTISKTR